MLSYSKISNSLSLQILIARRMGTLGSIIDASAYQKHIFKYKMVR